ncbi:bacterial alpha-L-rhamnosidase-domain-containing protein [Aspergillus novoparasiticus]|uniref:alpha-L-rhamnosidase n=1 Tax=Aspergillus novoparasiticus TaxID=986946 RepID=A0A5N6EWP9_9EURO|nr:bacterial alpha-L-rhamnosidase-domain-containing protein [Aspergillus novoparasiticus]
MALVTNVQFEHYHPPNTLGVQERKPRISWGFKNVPRHFRQEGYEIEIFDSEHTILSTVKRTSQQSYVAPWPSDQPLKSRQKISLRVRVWDGEGYISPWSEEAYLETGLLERSDWQCERIAAPWGPVTTGPAPEDLYRKEFSLTRPARQARLYITAQGVYEAEINGQRVGDYFMAPGWTTYDARLQYQTYDVTSMLSADRNCIGVRVAEGWFCGRIGFEGGHRNIWGPHTSLMAQLEVTCTDGRVDAISSDRSWLVTTGPIRLAEIYDGEKYDATREIACWSSPAMTLDTAWEPVLLMDPLPDSVELTGGFSEPVRRTEVIQPIQKVVTPSGKTILDFGQNLVGYVRLKDIRGPRGHVVRLTHAEVLEHKELGTRPLRICQAIDEYTLKGDSQGEYYEPRFTFHGFRYVQIDGWRGDLELETSAEAVVCHTDMKQVGTFSCSDSLLNQLYKNVCWGMRGNFLSVPTDCPQRDERLGWSGDLALFAPTATLIYDCFNMLRNWLIDVEHDQNILGGVPAMVTPNATLPDPTWCRRIPCAIWHDVTILAPWALYEETGDESILVQQYASMTTWLKRLPRNQTGSTHLWDTTIFQLGDWLDPAAPPDAPWKGATDAKLVANAFLIRSLDYMSRIAGILGKDDDRGQFAAELKEARKEFQDEYVTPNGRIISDSQAAYALAICFDLLTPNPRVHAGNRLVELVRKNEFKIGTGFTGTPYLCEALTLTGHIQVAYSMLLEKKCPSWLYPVTMGATTVWERWDSMLPDGTINPGEMTSFNHYAFGAIAKFLFERIAGLQRVEPGWKHFRVAPSIGAELTYASASHVTPYGQASCSWETTHVEKGLDKIQLRVSVPHGIACEVIYPSGAGEEIKTVGYGEWSFEAIFKRAYEWLIKPLPPKS